jgi:hypothetical protein
MSAELHKQRPLVRYTPSNSLYSDSFRLSNYLSYYRRLVAAHYLARTGSRVVDRFGDRADADIMDTSLRRGLQLYQLESSQRSE